MCCDTTMCGAQSEACRFAICAPGVVPRVSVRRRDSGIQSGTLMTSPRTSYPLEMTMNPVRQCARRGASVLDVAQASPLFSDHAPREVHLWQ